MAMDSFSIFILAATGLMLCECVQLIEKCGCVHVQNLRLEVTRSVFSCGKSDACSAFITGEMYFFLYKHYRFEC